MPSPSIVLISGGPVETAWQNLQHTTTTTIYTNGNTNISNQEVENVHVNVNANATWMLMQLKQNELQLIQTGKNGYCEMVTQLDQNEIMFGILVILAKDNCNNSNNNSTTGTSTSENNVSIRRRYVFFTFTGSHVSPFQTAQQAIHGPEIQALFPGVTIHMEADASLSTFTQKKIAQQLLKSTGAHAPNRISFGPNDEHSISELIA